MKPSEPLTLEPPKTETRGAVELIETLRGPGGTDLSADRRKASVEHVKEALAKSVASVESPVDEGMADVFIRSVEDVLARLGGDGPEAELSDGERATMEAVILTDGTRPAPYIRDGFIDLADPVLRDWKDGLARHEAVIRGVIGSTGRIVRDGDLSDDNVFGTAWMIGAGRAATAQHVIQQMADPGPNGSWQVKSGFVLDFSVEEGRPSDPARRFAVRRIDPASPDTIGTFRDPASLDAAVLVIEPNAAGDPPAPIALAAQANAAGLVQQRNLYSVGHPAKPSIRGWLTDDPNRENEERMLWTTLTALIGDRFGVKRLSPGKRQDDAGRLDGDAVLKRTISHDATTLGGSSGAPVLDLAGSPEMAVGLHIAGQFRKKNYAHWIPAVRDYLTTVEGPTG